MEKLKESYLNIIKENSYDQLKEKEEKLKALGLPYILFITLCEDNSNNFLDNIEILQEHNIELDSKEIIQSAAALFIPPTCFKINLEAILNYNVNLRKSNGKTSIQMLDQFPQDLINKIDYVIESGEEEILDYNPEFLAFDTYRTLANCTLLKSNGAEYRDYDKNDSNKLTKYKSILSNPITFAKTLELPEGFDYKSLIVLPEQNNENLSTMISNKEIINLMNEYFKGDDYGVEIKIDDSELELQINSMIQMVEKNAEQTNRAYIIAGIPFSKNKFKRNLTYLESKLKDMDPNSKMEEIIIASLVYNSNKSVEEIQKVIEALDFSVAMGGISL